MDINSKYSFTTYSTGYLGTFKSVTLLGIVNYSEAIKTADVGVIHNNIYNTLPAGTPKDPADLLYYILVNDSGAQWVISKSWIIQDTIVEDDGGVVQLSLTGVKDLDNLARLMRSEGYVVTKMGRF